MMTLSLCRGWWASDFARHHGEQKRSTFVCLSVTLVTSRVWMTEFVHMISPWRRWNLEHRDNLELLHRGKFVVWRHDKTLLLRNCFEFCVQLMEIFQHFLKHDDLNRLRSGNLVAIHPCWWSCCSLISATSGWRVWGYSLKNGPQCIKV